MFSVFVFVCIFFFKQKTAYEMRISDWSSDVCSSDLQDEHQATGRSLHVPERQKHLRARRGALGEPGLRQRPSGIRDEQLVLQPDTRADRSVEEQGPQIGRAACRERVCQYV